MFIKQNKKEEQKGITLVALVVTIVVLLILAGITITALFSENGIIKKAQEAKNATEQDQTNTQEGLANLADQMAVQLGEDVSSLGKLIKDGSFVTESQGHQKVTDKNGKTMYVPIGYKVTSDCNEIDKGVVIEDKDKNQFVWVPVTDINQMAVLQEGSTTNYRGVLYNFGTNSSPKDPPEVRSYSPNSGFREPAIVDNSSDGTGTLYDGSTSNINPILEEKYKDSTGAKKIQEQFQAQLQAEFNSMVASVVKYKGFYIGRYETGNLSGTAVVQKGNTDINNQKWYTMYKKGKTLKGENNNVTTSMIWGCQWDATLRWFQTSADTEVKKFVTDGTGKGNYAGTQTGGNAPIATGSNDDYKVNNIYDMAGNVNDWTIEAYHTGGRVGRGGFYNSSGSSIPASYRRHSTPNVSHDDRGFRSTLLINP